MPEDVSNTVVEDTRTNEQLDQLADATSQSRNSERQMKEASASKEVADKKTVAEEAYEFEHGGKKIKANREQLIKWAQMGYDRPQVMQKFNAEKQKFEQERQTLQEQVKKWEIYKQIDDHALKNPDWWNHILQGWQSRAAQQTATTTQPVPAGAIPPAGTVDPRIQTFEQKLAQFEQFVQQQQQEKAKQQEFSEDQKLDGEVKSIREQYKDLDWTALDSDGKNLELRVLEHAQNIGTNSFRVALRDLLHDDLITRAQSQAKIDVAKGIQTKAKLGVLGETTTSAKWNPNKKSSKNIKEMSYEDLEREAFEDLRAGRLG